MYCNADSKCHHPRKYFIDRTELQRVENNKLINVVYSVRYFNYLMYMRYNGELLLSSVNDQTESNNDKNRLQRWLL